MEYLYVLIRWPEIQYFMTEPGFKEHSCLANDEQFVDKFGGSSYFVQKTWADEVIDRLSHEYAYIPE